MFTPKGKFDWYELMTSDTEAAGKFYSDVIGWSIREITGANGIRYTTFNLGDVGVAGMLHIPGHTSWIGYIAVDDVDAHIEKIVEAGGKLWKPATDVPGTLRFAVMPDPQAPPLWSLHLTPQCRRLNAQRHPPPAPSVGMNSTQRILRAGLISTTSSLVGVRSSIWTWDQWVLIAFSTRANTNQWVTAA